MKSNMGNTDRLVRIIAAITIVVLYFAGELSGTVATVLLAIAGAFMLTSFTGFCPMYYPFKISTREKINKI